MKRIVGLVAALSVTACSMEPPVPNRALPVPPSWPAGDAYLAAAEAPLPSVTYRDLFRDPRLQALISQAMVNNRDLLVAAANIDAARAQVRITRANQLPTVDATGKASISGDGKGTTTQSYALDASVPAFELDLFGRLRSLTKADRQRLLATEAGARATKLSLVANIADAWVQYAADSSDLAIAEATAAAAAKSITLTRERLEGGIAPRTDLDQATQILETARGDLAVARAARAQDINALQLLVGAPVATNLLPASIDQVFASFAALPAGLDSRVLLRRPDVIQAEYEMRAANAQIGAARAALFPTISLTGLLGFASDALGSLFSAGAFAWSAGANASYTIFQSGAGHARVAQSKAERDAALFTYEKAIQTAFREVADALASRGVMAERLRSAAANRAAAADTARLTDARYRGGIDPFLTVLDASRTYYGTQRSEVAVRLAALQNLIDLYRTIGADRSL
ncbi:efflux transporter outer membrane subunit [Sphingomonas sp. ASV193]|uniref:efflux transporter outer membrane subunit n=1 Tax=Sphingomonas sp. ASV193 TaxID=3144405 RepID=UPI0032E89876